jgi:hypothetical protein
MYAKARKGGKFLICALHAAKSSFCVLINTDNMEKCREEREEREMKKKKGKTYRKRRRE